MDHLPTISFSVHNFYLLCAILLSVIFKLQVQGALHHALHYYQPLRSEDIKHHVVKRSTALPVSTNRVMTIHTMNKQFTLDLLPREDLFHKDFKVFSINKHGKKKQHQINKRAFYSGQVKGIPNSDVKAHFDGEELTARIITPEEEYRIEPSWRHISEPHDFNMIVYKTSDVKKNSSSLFCPHGHHLPKELQEQRMRDEMTEEQPETLAAAKSRYKRQAPPLVNTCPLLLTADYRFFENMGLKSINISINYLISLIDRVDPLYKRTVWAPDYHGFGFEIKEILIHETSELVDTSHYNSKREEAWNVQELLEAYSKMDHSAFCLAHLFTYQDFDKGVLGLAYIGTPRANAVGGICTKKYPSNSGDQYLNTGLTTTLNWGRRVLTDEADLVTAHELGHNFGSEHDPGNEAECSPSANQGGKYLMYPASVTGEQHNNKRFSICSKRLIEPVLRSKSPLCFKEVSGTSWCGNYRIDGDEQCDAGYEGKKNNDLCCDSSCRLKPGALCSDQNHPCCHMCQYASKTTICRQASADDSDCTQTANCTGRNAECPPSKPREDNSPCIDNGKCENGMCLPFCESQKLGLESCLCSGENACFRCCRTPSDGKCSPFMNSTSDETISVPNGRPCEEGVCVEGKCETRTQDIIARFFDVFEKINISILRRILKDNVVGATIIISLLFWVPCSCIVHHFDKKREAEVEKVDNWLNYTNTQRMLPEDMPRVRRNSQRAKRVCRSFDGQDTEHLLHWWDFQDRQPQELVEESL